MKPFFSYYGAKFTASGKMQSPRFDTVIEPFAGSAAYSVRWEARDVILIDKSEDICILWDFLIHASEREIADLPDSLENNEELIHLPDGPRQLLGFWVSKGRAEKSRTLSPWYFQYRNAKACRVWGPAVKERIARQLQGIRNWKIVMGCYKDAPDINAHWHIDPPYNNSAGSRYPHSEIDYIELSEWTMSRKGFVQVCENEGADWLPFKTLCEVVTSRGRRTGAVSKEAIFERFNIA